MLRLYLQSKGKSLAALSTSEKASEYENYLSENFSGLDPMEVVFAMAMPAAAESGATEVTKQIQVIKLGSNKYTLKVIKMYLSGLCSDPHFG